jgi:hypothetical protein
MPTSYSLGASSQTKCPASMTRRRLVGRRSSTYSALASGTTRSWRPLMSRDRRRDLWRQLGELRQLLGVPARVAHRLDEAAAVVAVPVVGADVVGMPPAIVSTATSTIARGSIRRYSSRSGSSTQDFNGSPSSSGTAAPPVPTIVFAIRSGCAAAANRAAGGPDRPGTTTRCAAKSRGVLGLSGAAG